MKNNLIFNALFLAPEVALRGGGAPERVAFIDDIIKHLLCLTVMYISQYP
jgi:hypothetical protein